MIEITSGRTKTVTYISNRLALGKLAEKYENEVSPAIEPFLMPGCLSFIDQFVENRSVEFWDNLRKQGYICHEEKFCFCCAPQR